MAGLRFGVALAHPAVAREIAKAKLPYNVNLFTLTAAEVALEHMDVRQDLVSRIIATRDRAFPRLSALPGITVYPSAGELLPGTVSLGGAGTRSTGGCWRSTTSWCGTFPAVPGLEQCLRISVGTDEDMVAVERRWRRFWDSRVVSRES